MSNPGGSNFREITRLVQREPAPVLEAHSRIIYNAMTVDVEDYFQVSNFEPYIRPNDWSKYEATVDKGTDRILALFNKLNVKATFFVLGWVAERYPKIVKAIDREGHEVASHGYWHKRVFVNSPEHFREDIRRSKNTIEDILGHKVYGHRAPTFSINQDALWALDILLEEGFEYDSSLFPGRIYRPGFSEAFRYPHNIDRGDLGLIKEIPMTTLRMMGVRVPFAGGGYFRLYPYPFIKWGMNYINKVEKSPVIVYFHPWEFVPDQPRIKKAGLWPKFKHYVNLSTFESKISRMLEDFHFKTCLELVDHYRL